MRRVRAALGHGTRTSALVLLFFTSTIGGVILHANTPAMRRVAQQITNEATKPAFAGRLLVEDVRELHLLGRGHVRAGRVRVLDPEGRVVIDARDVDATIRLGALLGSIARGRPPEIAIDSARIEHADVALDLDAAGTLGIERAFLPPPKPAAPGGAAGPTPSSPAEEDVILRMPSIFVKHAWAHGNLVPPRLDGDAEDVRGKIAIEKNVFRLVIEEGKTTLRSPRAPLQEVDLVGHAKGDLTVPLGEGELSGQASFDGSAGGIPVRARLGVDQANLDASFDVDDASPAAMARAFPLLRTRDPLSVHATAKGKLPEVRVVAEAKTGASDVKADGSYDFRAGHPFRLDVDVAHADGGAFGLTESDVTARGHVEGANGEGGAIGTFRITSDRGKIAGETVPALVIDGRFEPKQVTTNVRAEEAGVRANAKLVLDVAKKQVTFDAQARTDDLRRIPKADGIVSGSGSARARGRIDLATDRVSADVDVDAQHVAHGAFSAGSATGHGRVSGTLASPAADVTFEANDVRVTAPGKEPLTHRRASGSAHIAFAPTPRVEGAELRIGDSVHAKAESIDLGGGRIVVRGARVTGLGAPVEAEIVTSGRMFRIRVKADDVDVHRAESLTGIAQLGALPDGTRATIDVDLAGDERGARGHARLALSGESANADFRATIDGRRVSAEAHADLRGVAHLDAKAVDVEMPDLRDPMRAAGALEISGAIDLSRGAAMFGGEDIERLGGVLTIEGHVDRPTIDGPIHARTTLATHGLVVVLASGKTFSGADVSVHADYDGNTDDTSVSAAAWDEKGLFASADAKSKVPWTHWASGRTPFGPQALEALYVHARADIAERRVEDLPLGFAFRGTKGIVAVDATLEGLLARPRVLLHGTARELADASSRDARRAAPLDGVIDARWDGEDLTAAVGFDERRGRKREEKAAQIRGLAIGKLRAAELVRVPFGGRVRWDGSAEVDVSDLEIAPLPLPESLRGVVTGRASIRDLGTTPSFQAHARVAGLGIRGARIDETNVAVGARDGSLFVSLRAQDEKGEGVVRIASRALRWKGTDLSFDGKAPTSVEYDVRAMRLAILRPLVRRVFPEFDGRVDGRGSMTVDESAQVFEGGLSVTDGRFYLTAVGEEITNVSATARFEKSGAFRIERATGRAGSGEVVLTAAGHMDGFRFRDAQGVANVPSKEGVPLSSEGATYAEATGEVRFDARMSEKRDALLLTLNIPRANVEIPRRDAQALQDLEPDPSIAIGVRRGETLEAAPRRRRRGGGGVDGEDEVAGTKITVSLGDEVIIEGRGLRVALGGRALVDIAEEVRVTGRVDLRSGTIEVHGRRFVVDRGTITWPPGSEPDNPTIIAAAYWDAPDRTRIWVEFTGPFETGALTLRSEPPHSKNEILSILLFGRPDPNMASAGQRPTDASRAAAVGTGFVASDINSVLSQIDENLDYETDTLSGNRTRTKVGYRLRRNLRVQLGYAPGRSYREPDTTFLFLDWQFVPKWSLIATRGDRGTSILDVLFQHRY